MSLTNDARFWDRSSRKYARGAIADLAGYARTLEATRAWIGPDDRVLELGCGTGTTAFRLAGHVRSYLATDISAGMIEIAREKQDTELDIAGLAFHNATAEQMASQSTPRDAVLGFNYLHLVRDLPGTLDAIHTMLAKGGVFISKTPCLADMNPFIRLALLPAMRALGKAPYVSAFSTTKLCRMIVDAGFELLAVENHATKSDDHRPFIVARKR
ncbi:class I SAM-dependent methyltransferase [uncultured Nitratireductor sp.]|uniref:class I SAM-dependent methyltransferase n=1 Tax=uncultured Nitratireductor sp. TaxID=520953 RepID=UPI0025FEAD9C|nr:class I SAM-dependent methyltransferase [uncultured Nitratireductor sp.]